jgi:hypothetical protein
MQLDGQSRSWMQTCAHTLVSMVVGSGVVTRRRSHSEELVKNEQRLANE